jgi:hypothetical protein
LLIYLHHLKSILYVIQHNIIYNMLFRDITGNIVEINKSNFISDSEYYKAISLTLGIQFIPKTTNIKTKISGLIKK